MKSGADKVHPAPAPGGLAWWWTVLIVGFLMLASVRFPHDAAGFTTNVDSSWKLLLWLSHELGLQFGVDAVYTYGPLGYLFATEYAGGDVGPPMAFQLVVNLLNAWIVAVVLAGLGRGWRTSFLALIVVVPLFPTLGPFYRLGQACLVLSACSSTLRRNLLLLICAAGGLLQACLALVKFTELLTAAAVVIGLSGFFILNRRWAELTALSGTFLLAFPSGWLISGQQLGNLPTYFYHSLSVTTGLRRRHGPQ